MKIVRISRQVKLCLGLIAASVVGMPIAASAADLYVGNNDGTISRITSSGVVSTYVTGLPTGGSGGLAFDSSGNLYYDVGAEIDKITPSGVISKFATIGAGYSGLVSDSSNNLYVGGALTPITKITPSGTKSTFPGGSFVVGLAFDAGGNLYASSFSGTNGVIKEFTPSGAVSTFATGLSNSPTAIAFGPSASTTAVPEPFTIIGTLVGGTAAFRMRKKFKATNKL